MNLSGKLVIESNKQSLISDIVVAAFVVTSLQSLGNTDVPVTLKGA